MGGESKTGKLGQIAMKRSAKGQFEGLHKLDALAVLDGLKAGKSQVTMAKEQGIDQTTISRFLSTVKTHFKTLDAFSIDQGKVLLYTLARAMTIQNQALDEIQRQLAENTKKAPHHRHSLDKNLQIAKGITWIGAVTFDKMRLEGGLSTQNHSIAGLIRHAHENIGLFDEKSGEFKASVTGPLEKNASTQTHALKQSAHNELAPHESPMPIDDGETMADKSHSVNS
ncbi:MAG: hypothetical protein IH977_15285 [Nitrospinae bacterium]|nr:hypothetical protein [Nitrospinota bacterium]